jgi:hypothetical protein
MEPIPELRRNAPYGGRPIDLYGLANSPPSLRHRSGVRYHYGARQRPPADVPISAPNHAPCRELSSEACRNAEVGVGATTVSSCSRMAALRKYRSFPEGRANGVKSTLAALRPLACAAVPPRKLLSIKERRLPSAFVLFCVAPEGAPWRKREKSRRSWLRISSATSLDLPSQTAANVSDHADQTDRHLRSSNRSALKSP